MAKKRGGMRPSGELTARPGPNARRDRYPWNEWFGMGKFILRKGKHFHVQTHGFLISIRQAATRRKLKVSIITKDDGKLIDVTVIKTAGPKKGRAIA